MTRPVRVCGPGGGIYTPRVKYSGTVPHTHGLSPSRTTSARDTQPAAQRAVDNGRTSPGARTEVCFSESAFVRNCDARVHSMDTHTEPSLSQLLLMLKVRRVRLWEGASLHHPLSPSRASRPVGRVGSTSRALTRGMRFRAASGLGRRARLCFAREHSSCFPKN